MKYGRIHMSWREFLNSTLPINSEVISQSENWQKCAIGERVVEMLTGGGTTIPQHLGWRATRWARIFTKQIRLGQKQGALKTLNSIQKPAKILKHESPWLKERV